jgi:hypothetical protein
MVIVNLTPHSITVCDENDKPLLILPPSGKAARVSVKYVQCGTLALTCPRKGIPVYQAEYGSVVDMPDPELDTAYVVSGMTAVALAGSGRTDIFVPGDLIRDETGNPIGCRGFRVP